MIEYRVVCANHGNRGHSTHAWRKPNLKKATQAVIDLNHAAEMNRTAFYANEAPYRVESRDVSKWGIHYEEHVCPTCGEHETPEDRPQCGACAGDICASCQINQAEAGEFCEPCLRHESSFTH